MASYTIQHVTVSNAGCNPILGTLAFKHEHQHLASSRAILLSNLHPGMLQGALKGAAAHHLPSGVPGTLLKVPEVVDIKQDGVESAEARFATPSSGLKAERSKGSTLT